VHADNESIDVHFVGEPDHGFNSMGARAMGEIGITINAGFFPPAGLDLGAKTPEEIALAIISEIQRVFAGGSGDSLRERKRSIHGMNKLKEWNTLSVRVVKK
jgi:hypothetical protein